MEFERYDDGVPSWVDLGSPDLAKSREFYGALFGWNCPEGPPEAGGYSVCDLGGKTVAGLGPQMNPDMPPVWMTYVNVDSADDTVGQGDRQRRHGLRRRRWTSWTPAAWPSSPTRSAPSSASGSPTSTPGAQLANEPGTYCWSELITTDLDASKAFYKAVFGWDAEDQGPPGGPPAYTEWKLAGRSVGGMMPKNADDAGRDAAQLGRLLRGGRHRRHRGQGAGARRHRCSWGRPTSNRGASPSWPTTSGAVFNVLQLKG